MAADDLREIRESLTDLKDLIEAVSVDVSGLEARRSATRSSSCNK